MNALWATIRAELFKIVRKRRTYVIAGLWWLLLPVLVLITAQVLYVNVGDAFLQGAGGVQQLVQALASPFGLARVGLTGPAFLSPSFYIITVALLAALFIGEERSLSMWKTTLVAQPARLAVLWGKIVVAMITLGVLMAGALVSGVAFGFVGMTFLPTDASGAWGSLLGLYGLQWLNAFGAVTFAFLMLFVIRNVALGMVSVFFIPVLLESLYRFWRLTVGFEPINRMNAVFQALQLRRTLESLPRYFFTDNLYLPARLPARQIAEQLGASAADMADMGQSPFAAVLGGTLTLGHSLLVMAGYGLLFAALLSWAFLRRDVD